MKWLTNLGRLQSNVNRNRTEPNRSELYPEVCQIIEQISIVSRSGWISQHQGLDAILEEVNKALKALIPPVPTQKHWEIAARNCIKFLMVIINTIYLL